MLPEKLRVEAGLAQPGELITRAVGLVVAIAQRGDLDVGGDDIAEDESPTRTQRVVDASEELSLLCGIEVVHSKRGHDQVEAPGRKRILEPGDAWLDIREVDPIQHAGAHIHRDDRRVGMPSPHSARCFAGPGSQVENATRGNAVGRGRQTFLQLLIGRHVGGDQIAVRRGVEVELVHLG